MTMKTVITILLGACLSLGGCDTKTKNVDSCGDGFVDPGEQCDTTVGENSCASLGYYNALGMLTCMSDCQFNVDSCGGRCGDDDVDGENGEQCDGGNLNGQTCESLGYTGGTLSCGAGCTYDTSGCAGKCGNGTLDTDEGEVCDGGNLNGQTCETLGFHGGALGCEADCSGYNLDACTAVGRCGDGVIQETYGEVCDGANLDGQTCGEAGYYGGQLACGVDCLQLDLTDCEAEGRCGDGIIQENYPELCDGDNLGWTTCVDQGYSARGGALSCTAGCMFDESACLPISDNADLATLSVSEGTLTPPFMATRISYSVEVPLSVTVLTVTATTADAPWATVEITPAQPMTLVEGENLATVTVTAEDGSEKQYLVVVNRTQDLVSPNVGRMIHVPAGTFQRDSIATNLSTMSSFRMSRYEITRDQWVAVTGWVDPSLTSWSGGTNDPVQNVNWYHAIAFCNKLSLLEGLTPVYTVSGVDFATLTYAQIPPSEDALWNAATADWDANGYRLPTEMEWMWAAMGADTAAPESVNTTGYEKLFAGSTGTNAIGDFAVFGYFSSGTGRTMTERSNPVGSKLANELGIYDLSGNVQEWIWDWENSFPWGTVVDYRGLESGYHRVMHGGSWRSESTICTLSYREARSAYLRNMDFGFRVVRN